MISEDCKPACIKVWSLINAAYNSVALTQYLPTIATDDIYDWHELSLTHKITHINTKCDMFFFFERNVTCFFDEKNVTYVSIVKD